MNIDGEKALTVTNAKFIHRFLAMEELVARDGLQLDKMTLAEMDRYWEEAKRGEQDPGA